MVFSSDIRNAVRMMVDSDIFHIVPTVTFVVATFASSVTIRAILKTLATPKKDSVVYRHTRGNVAAGRAWSDDEMRELDEHISRNYNQESNVAETIQARPPLPAPASKTSNKKVPSGYITGSSPRKSSKDAIDIGVNFKMVFITIVALTAVSGLIAFGIAAIWENPTANQQSAFEMFRSAWIGGLGVVFGLLGGKALR